MAQNNKGARLLVVEKHTAEEWMQDDNLMILRGIALQCLSYADLAKCLQISLGTLSQWRKKHPEIREAIDVTRDTADSVVISASFDQVMRGNEIAAERWWRYRIAPKEKAFNDERFGTSDAIGADNVILNIPSSWVKKQDGHTDQSNGLDGADLPCGS